MLRRAESGGRQEEERHEAAGGVCGIHDHHCQRLVRVLLLEQYCIQENVSIHIAPEGLYLL